LNRNLLTDKQNDYHLLLRLVRYEYTTHWKLKKIMDNSLSA
jgi:hypothetical protein